MISTLQFILVPLLACILLLVITSYFGIHVLKREIIFIDIALAQIAALGGVLVIFIDHEVHTHEGMGSFHLADILAYVASLVFCLGASVIFTYLKSPKIKVPIEAFIGIAYALATTAAVIILDKGAGSDVHLHDMLTGSLLWTTWPQVIRLALVLSVIGGFHLIYRRKFVQLTALYHENNTGGMKHQKRWDFLFYFTFGIMIIEAIKVAGVLTVFAFLILPASISALFALGWRQRILIGLGSGIFAALIGLYLLTCHSILTGFGVKLLYLYCCL